MTKRHLVGQLSDQLGITQNQASAFVEAFLQTVEKAVSAGNEVTFRTFGTFALKLAKGKVGRNPSQPDVPMEIPARCVLRFRPSRELKERVANLPMDTVKIGRRSRARKKDSSDGLNSNHG